MSVLISDATLARLQAIDESAMPDACRVLRRTDVTTGGRTSKGDPAAVGGTVDCRLAASGLQPVEAELVGRLADVTHGSVALPLGTDVAAADLIDVTTDYGTTRFEVVGDPWTPSYATSIRANVRREG